MRLVRCALRDGPTRRSRTLPSKPFSDGTLGTNAVLRIRGASECLKCEHIAWKRSGGGHMVRGGCMASGEAISSEFWAVLDSRRSYVWALRSAAVGR